LARSNITALHRHHAAHPEPVTNAIVVAGDPYHICTRYIAATVLV
jgi:hypothetical protein